MNPMQLCPNCTLKDWRYAAGTPLEADAGVVEVSVKGRLLAIYLRAADNNDSTIRIGAGGDIITVRAGEVFNIDQDAFGPFRTNIVVRFVLGPDFAGSAGASWFVAWAVD